MKMKKITLGLGWPKMFFLLLNSIKQTENQKVNYMLSLVSDTHTETGNWTSASWIYLSILPFFRDKEHWLFSLKYS